MFICNTTTFYSECTNDYCVVRQTDKIMYEMNVISKWKKKSEQLKLELHALYFAYKHPKTPLHAKVFMALVIGYAISPVDLIPEFIPVLGYLDDLLIVSAGVYLTLKLVPQPVMDECREKAKGAQFTGKEKWIGAGIIIAIWVVVLLLLARFVLRILHPT